MVAAAAALTLVGSLLTAGSVQAAGDVEVSGERVDLATDPVWASRAFSPGELGQAVVGEWAAADGGGTASAQLPGGVGTVRVTAPPSDQVRQIVTESMVRAGSTEVAELIYKNSLGSNSDNPETVNCLAEIPRRPAQQPPVGSTKLCGQRELTVTFERPTVDPILWLGTGSFVPVYTLGSAANPCYHTWQNSSVVRVDGAAPGAHRLEHVSSAQNVDVSGTYWLRETTAPAGHELLAAPVRLEVAVDGTVTVLDAGSAQVLATGSTLTVTDTPSFQLPDTGSTGRAPLAVGGAVLLAGTALALRLLRPRARPAHVPVTQAGRRPGS